MTEGELVETEARARRLSRAAEAVDRELAAKIDRLRQRRGKFEDQLTVQGKYESACREICELDTCILRAQDIRDELCQSLSMVQRDVYRLLGEARNRI